MTFYMNVVVLVDFLVLGVAYGRFSTLLPGQKQTLNAAVDGV